MASEFVTRKSGIVFCWELADEDSDVVWQHFTDNDEQVGLEGVLKRLADVNFKFERNDKVIFVSGKRFSELIDNPMSKRSQWLSFRGTLSDFTWMLHGQFPSDVAVSALRESSTNEKFAIIQFKSENPTWTIGEVLRQVALRNGVAWKCTIYEPNSKSGEDPRVVAAKSKRLVQLIFHAAS